MTVRFADVPAVRVLGSGSRLPGPNIDNATLLAALASALGRRRARKAGIIARQLGVAGRHFSYPLAPGGGGPSHDAPTLCAGALGTALAQAGRSSDELSYLVAHTATPHTLLPPNAAWVAARLRFAGPYLELRQACTGFASALQIAAPMLAAGGSDQALALIGSELGSAYFRFDETFVDDEQLINFVQMGDGAGAVVLAAADGGERGVISDMYIGHLGNGRPPGFFLEGGGSGHAGCPAGLPRFRHNAEAVKRLGGELYLAGLAAVAQRGYALADFDWLLPHQANGHLARLFSQQIGIDEERVVVDADTLGNLGSAAIWVSFDRLRRSGRLAAGDRVLVLGAEATKYLYGGFVYRH